MTKQVDFPSNVGTKDFLTALTNSFTTRAIEELIGKLPITDVNSYQFDPDAPETGWQPGRYHWLPVGRDRGNGGRIRLAGKPIYPPAERLINGMEALIEMLRLRELAKTPAAASAGEPARGSTAVLWAAAARPNPAVATEDQRQDLARACPRVRPPTAARPQVRQETEGVRDLRARPGRRSGAGSHAQDSAVAWLQR